jgi:predicted XRE-type DNA-binding protein
MSSDEATILALRRDLALQIARIARRAGETQTAAARRLGMPQPTLSKIINSRVSDLSIEFLLRVAVRAKLPIAMQTGRNSKEAGAFVSSFSRRSQPSKSKLAHEARRSLSQADRRLTPSERLGAFLEHNQLIGALHQGARPENKRHASTAPSAS